MEPFFCNKANIYTVTQQQLRPAIFLCFYISSILTCIHLTTVTSLASYLGVVYISKSHILSVWVLVVHGRRTTEQHLVSDSENAGQTLGDNAAALMMDYPHTHH